MRKKIFIALSCLALALGINCLPTKAGQPEHPADESIETYTIKNQYLVFTAGVVEKHLVHQVLSNRFSHLPYYMEGEEFILEFQGKKIKASEMVVEKIESAPESIRVFLSSDDFPLEARLEFRISQTGNYLEKILSIRMTKGEKFLSSIQLVDQRKGKEAPQTFPGPGQPVYKKSRFFAIAYPLSHADITGGEVRIRYDVGKMLDGEWYQSYPAVLGVAEDNKVPEYFFRYLDQARHRPAQPFLLYNTWYDMPGNVSSRAVVNSISGIMQNLTGPFGIKLDAVVLDDGWDNYKKLWEIDSQKMPEGMEPVKISAARIGARPGMWLSPAGGYGARKNERIFDTLGQGYEKNIWAGAIRGGFCPAGEKYHQIFQSRIVNAVENGVVYFKLDNIGASCPVPWHGHRQGKYSMDAVADSLIQVMDAAHQKNPAAFFNITVGAWLSPFWLKYADCVWMGGMDYGFSGPGSEREKNITYRDQNLYKQFREKNYQFPMNAVMTHGVIKANTNFKKPEPVSEFEHDVAMYFSRGISMWELYISPDLLTKEEWAVFAKWIKWANDNWEILKQTKMVLGDPNKLEVYGYLHEKDHQAILVLRNPSNKTQTINLTPEMLAMKDFKLAEQEYPVPQKFEVSSGKISLELSPFQVAIIKISREQI